MKLLILPSLLLLSILMAPALRADKSTESTNESIFKNDSSNEQQPHDNEDALSSNEENSLNKDEKEKKETVVDSTAVDQVPTEHFQISQPLSVEGVKALLSCYEHTTDSTKRALILGALLGILRTSGIPQATTGKEDSTGPL